MSDGQSLIRPSREVFSERCSMMSGCRVDGRRLPKIFFSVSNRKICMYLYLPYYFLIGRIQKSTNLADGETPARLRTWVDLECTMEPVRSRLEPFPNSPSNPERSSGRRKLLPKWDYTVFSLPHFSGRRGKQINTISLPVQFDPLEFSYLRCWGKKRKKGKISYPMKKFFN